MEQIQRWQSIIRKNLWLILLLTAISMGVSAATSLNEVPEYESTVTLLLNMQSQSPIVDGVNRQDATQIAASYSALIRTTSFGNEVAAALPFALSAEQVERKITTRLEPSTLFYQLIARADNPEHARQLVTTVADKLIARTTVGSPTDPQGDVRSEMQARLEDRLRYLDEQVALYQDRLAELNEQPVSTARNDEIFRLETQLLNLQEMQTNTIVALAQLPENSAPVQALSFLDPALLGTPVRSRLVLNLALAFIVSTLLGLALAFLRDYFDYKGRAADFLREATELEPVVSIALVKEGRRKSTTPYGNSNGKNGSAHTADIGGPAHVGTTSGLLAMSDHDTPEIESFRMLRTAIQFSRKDQPVHSIVVTSAAQQEGKSFVASNLAVVCARSDRRVVLVDGDMRRPSMHTLFGLQNTVGLSNLLDDKTLTVEAVMQAVPGLPSLKVITSGPLPDNPSELLASRHATQVVAELASRAELVIYDTPPAALFTDPVLLAGNVDAVALVIKAGSIRREKLEQVMDDLQSAGVSNILPVLNQVTTSDTKDARDYYRSAGRR